MRLSRAGEFEQSLAFASKWIEEEPFSNAAYRAAVWAASIAEQYEVADKLCLKGLRFNSGSSPLLNTRVFVLASQGRVVEAVKVLNSIRNFDEDASKLVVEANRGLIAFRMGNPIQGMAHYQSAIAGFQKANNERMERHARAYLAREAARVGLNVAAELIAETEKMNVRPQLPEVARILQSATASLSTGKEMVP